MVVVLGDPEARITQSLAVLRQRHGVADGNVSRLTGGGDGLVEDGKTLHHAAQPLSGPVGARR